jgi:carbonic anhydrase
MEKSFKKVIAGYKKFREKYASGDESVMHYLSQNGQTPKIMVVACCDSRVDPALILQCDPGDLFVVRNVANIVPNFEKDDAHHGTSAALEFAICFLQVKHLILLGHSQCGGIQALLDANSLGKNDFISNWVSSIEIADNKITVDECAKIGLKQSYQHCLTFPWILEKVKNEELFIHSWFFDIKAGKIFTYCEDHNQYNELE